VNAGLYFIFLFILFSVFFHLLFLFYLGLGWSVMSHDTVTGSSHHVTVIVTISCDTEKVVKGSRTDDIIQHDKSILALWITHGH